MINHLPDEWAAISEQGASLPRASGGWSRKQIAGHLIDSATVNHQRFIRALAGEDNFNLLYAQEEWVALNGYQHREWKELLCLWEAINRHLLTVCRQIRSDQSELISGHGGDTTPWTLAYRVPDYVEHLKMHVEQMRRGPWQ